MAKIQTCGTSQGPASAGLARGREPEHGPQTAEWGDAEVQRAAVESNTPQRLQRNAERAGVASRLSVQVADMRTLPFEPQTFDAAMSVAALDHLDWPGIRQTLHEVARVLRPGGQLLIGGLNPDLWVRLAVPSSMHGGYWGTAQNLQRWREELEGAGFQVDESGTQPATVYLLAHLGQ